MNRHPGEYQAEIEVNPWGCFDVSFDTDGDGIEIKTVEFRIGDTSTEIPLEGFSEDQVDDFKEFCIAYLDELGTDSE